MVEIIFIQLNKMLSRTLLKQMRGGLRNTQAFRLNQCPTNYNQQVRFFSAESGTEEKEEPVLSKEDLAKG